MMKTDVCGCCKASSPATPEKIENRPGLSAIAYRAGTYSSVRQAMIEVIAKKKELRDLWTARTSPDYGIALIEMWAYLADILTFYQERIANEAYLRTALLRESVQRLTGLISYKPAPGLAAAAYLAFMTEEDEQVDIPVGLRVQSVPGQDEKPRKFETIQTITAYASLNKVRVFPGPQSHKPLAPGNTCGILYPDEEEAGCAELAEKDKLVIFAKGSSSLEEKEVESLESIDGLTCLTWSPAIQVGALNMRMFKWVGKLRLFGHNAPESFLKGEPVSPGSTELEWMEMETDFTIDDGSMDLNLDTLYDDLKAGTPILISTPEFNQFNRITGVDQTGAAIKGEFNTTTANGPLYATVTRITLEYALHAKIGDLRKVIIYELAEPEILFWNYRYPETVLGNKVYVRLCNPGSPLLSVSDLKDPTSLFIKLRDAKDKLSQYIKNKFSKGLQNLVDSYSASHPPSESMQRAVIDGLNTLLIEYYLYDEERFSEVILTEGLYAVLGQEMKARALVRLNRLLLEEAYPDEMARCPRFEDLTPGRPIILDDSEKKPQLVIVTGIRPLDCLSDGSHVVITFTPSLERSLDSATAVLYGNIAKATHGETVQDEVLGDGNAADEFQSFKLKKSPVTFLPDPGAANGAGNTLEVRVGGVLWNEVDVLYGQTEGEQIYTASTDEEGKMHVRFGDGKTGARLPSGRGNILGTYRQGLGQDGNVSADSLTTLLDRLVGLKSVTNPDRAQGGAEPEALEEMRTNAPNTVRTFGRIVSLRDFEDAAREYSGIAKSLATCVWDGEDQVVFLTVAGDEGVEVGNTVKADLKAYLDARRDPNRGMRLESYRKVPIKIEAKIQADAAYKEEDVQKKAKAALYDYFDFDNLELGRPIHLSDIYPVLQEVEGVVAVDIDILQFKSDADRIEHGASNDPVQGHLRIYSARVLSTHPVLMAPAELAEIREPINDLVVKTGLIKS